LAGISKQALHQHNVRRVELAAEHEKIFEQANAIRAEHPMLGCRKMGYMLRSKGKGRDKIEHLLLAGGYRVKYAPNYLKTTQSMRQNYYPNLIGGMELTGINQALQTDITYYWLNGKFYYLTFIIDVYSRRIVGHYTGSTMEAECNIKAMKMALKTRNGTSFESLIHHSDRGSQYGDKQYRQLLADNKIKASMCKEAWENAYTERINRTIKEEYLNEWTISDYKALVKAVNKAVSAYNNSRPHISLNMMSPISFERHVQNLDENQRPKMKIYKAEPKDIHIST
jgi:putative transposase